MIEQKEPGKPFDFSLDYLLQNEVVKLSPLGIEHAAPLAELAKEKSIWTYFLDEDSARGKIKSYIQSATADRQAARAYPFVVFDKRKKQYAGCTRFYNYHFALGTIKLGHTWYGQQFWGTGLNLHCKFLLFEFAFEQLGLHRIGFGVHAENSRSIKALEKIACKREGTLRAFLPSTITTERADLHLYGLLKGEWQNGAKEQLKLKCKLLHQ